MTKVRRNEDVFSLAKGTCVVLIKNRISVSHSSRHSSTMDLRERNPQYTIHSTWFQPPLLQQEKTRWVTEFRLWSLIMAPVGARLALLVTIFQGSFLDIFYLLQTLIHCNRLEIAKLSSIFNVCRLSFVPHPWHLFSSPLYDVSDHTNHIFSERIWSWQHVSVIHCWVEPSLLFSSYLFSNVLQIQGVEALNLRDIF